MRVCYDTEFHERGARSPIEFISIGMVRGDGEEYYAINSHATWWAIYKNEWLRANVLTQLPGRIKNWGNGGGDFEPDESSGLYKPPDQIAAEISAFCLPKWWHKDAPRVELWGDYSDYDHVVLASLFGRMIDLPPHMPMYTRDVRQVIEMLAIDLDIPQQTGAEHNALEDARWVSQVVAVLDHALEDHWWIDL